MNYVAYNRLLKQKLHKYFLTNNSNDHDSVMKFYILSFLLKKRLLTTTIPFLSNVICTNTHCLRKFHETNGTSAFCVIGFFFWLWYKWILNFCAFKKFIRIFTCKSIQQFLFVPSSMTQQNSCCCCLCWHLCA